MLAAVPAPSSSSHPTLTRFGSRAFDHTGHLLSLPSVGQEKPVGGKGWDEDGELAAGQRFEICKRPRHRPVWPRSKMCQTPGGTRLLGSYVRGRTLPVAPQRLSPTVTAGERPSSLGRHGRWERVRVRTHTHTAPCVSPCHVNTFAGGSLPLHVLLFLTSIAVLSLLFIASPSVFARSHQYSPPSLFFRLPRPLNTHTPASFSYVRVCTVCVLLQAHVIKNRRHPRQTEFVPGFAMKSF